MNIVIVRMSYHKSSQCRLTQRWQRTADTCHWLHTRQRAGTRTCHPDKHETQQRLLGV